METQYIVGTLAPTKPEAITPRTYRHIYSAITKNKLYGVVFSENWESGILTLDNHTPEVTPDDCSSPFEFICRIKELINAPGIKELGLKGEIVVTVPGLHPVVFRLVIQDNVVLHWASKIVWDKDQMSFF